MMTKQSESRTTNHERRTGRIFVLSAPSGCGKTTLLKKLLKDKELRLAHSISMTSRPPREDEQEGVDYHFVSQQAFKEKMKKDEFLEWEENFGNFYGTPRRFVEEAMAKGENIIFSIDVKGAMNIRKAFPKDSTLIFILPPSVEALEERLWRRKTDDTYVISKRLEIAKDEMSYKDRYDYCVVNDNLANAYIRLKEIIVSSIEPPCC